MLNYHVETFKKYTSQRSIMCANKDEKANRLYQKSDIIFEENSSGNEMYILRSGKVKLVLGDPEQGVEVGTVEETGDFFGEMALIDQSPRSATAIADDYDTELEVLDRDDFLKMIREYPEFALRLMHELCERLRVGNILYLEVIKGAMTPFCRQNCLGKVMDAFARQAMSGTSTKSAQEAAKMTRWKCTYCDYIYIPEYGDPDGDVSPGIPFEELPDTWKCPGCGVAKGTFQKI